MVVLVIQAALSLRLVWSNTAFTDEALYLWAGHVEIAHWLKGIPVPRSSIPAFPTYFSGAPVIYPPLGAIANAYGGLAGARLLSMALMLGTTILLYATASRLFGRNAALAAAAIFAFLGPTQFLSAFATFDALALFLLALATWLVIRADGWASEPVLIAAGLVLALADATKYATALWNPVVILLAAFSVGSCSRLRPAFRIIRLTVYITIPLALALFRFGGPTYIRGLMYTTLSRQTSGPTTAPALVLETSFTWLWLVVALAIIAVVVSFKDSLRTRLLCIVLTGAMLLAPLHQAQIHTLTSLHKHVDFGAWFGAIAAGYILARAAEYCRAKGWRILVAATGVVVFTGIIQTDALFPTGWPDMTGTVAIMGRVIPADHCPCFVMSNTVVEYYLLSRVSPIEDGDITGPFGFHYWDNKEHKDLAGEVAYTHAIRDHYFSAVEIDPAQRPSLYKSAVRALATSAGYQKVTTIPIPHWPGRVVEIWRYEPQRDQQTGSRHAGHN